MWCFALLGKYSINLKTNDSKGLIAMKTIKNVSQHVHDGALTSDKLRYMMTPNDPKWPQMTPSNIIWQLDFDLIQYRDRNKDGDRYFRRKWQLGDEEIIYSTEFEVEISELKILKEEVVYTLGELLSDVGGVCGFFLGSRDLWTRHRNYRPVCYRFVDSVLRHKLITNIR